MANFRRFRSHCYPCRQTQRSRSVSTHQRLLTKDVCSKRSCKTIQNGDQDVRIEESSCSKICLIWSHLYDAAAVAQTRYGSVRIFKMPRSFVRLFADGCPSDLTEEADCQCDQIWRNFRHLGKILKVFGHFLINYLVFGKTVKLLWQIFFTFGQSLIVIKAKYWTNILAIWSHCWLHILILKY